MKDASQIAAELAKPFRGKDLEWRIQRAGVAQRTGEIFAIVVPYVTARAIMDRLDEVVGPAGWQTAPLTPTGPLGKGTGLVGGIGIKIGDEWVWKYDVAQATDIEGVKGAASGALKRAAVHWGMGRDLYGVGDLYAKIYLERTKGAHYANPEIKVKGEKKKVQFWWTPPELPEPAPQAKVPAPAGEPRQGEAKVPASERPGVDDLERAEKVATERYGGPTKKQAALFAKLFRSSVFSAEERTAAASWLAEKSSQENINPRIDRAQASLKERKGKAHAA